jgi:hypothetical protein
MMNEVKIVEEQLSPLESIVAWYDSQYLPDSRSYKSNSYRAGSRRRSVRCTTSCREMFVL